MKKLWAYILLWMAVSASAQSNEGREFWLSFMEHVDSRANTMAVMITSRFDTKGLVSMPGINWNVGFNVVANQVTIIRVPTEAENIGSEAIQNLGIQVQSDLPVSVYMHQHSNLRSDASIVLPIDVLGKEYFTMNYNGFSNMGRFYPSEFVIVATADDTEVNIRPNSQTVSGRRAGSTYSILMQRGQTYQVQAYQREDFTGSYITSSKPVAVYSGNAWTEIPAGCPNWDNLLEIMPPVETWGKQYISVPSKLSYEKIRILASENGTKVTITGANTNTISIDRGQAYEFNVSEPVYMSSDKPVMVAKLFPGRTCSSNNANGDPAMLVLNSIEQTRDSVVMFNSSLQNIEENFISIIMLTEDASNVELDGKKLTDYGAIIPVPGNQKYSYITVRVQAGTHNIFSAGCGVIAYAFGFGNAESYAYGGGASYKSINQNPIIDGGCAGEEISFLGGEDTIRFRYKWEFENGETSTNANYSRRFPDTGSFNIKLELFDRCLNDTSFYEQDIIISRRKLLEISPDTQLCFGKNLSLIANDVEDVKYTWTGPSGHNSNEQIFTADSVDETYTGSYAVVGNYFGCESFPSTTNVIVYPLPEVDLIEKYIFCNRDSLLTLNAGEFVSYQWSDGQNGSIHTFDNAQPIALLVEDSNGCFNGKSIDILTACAPFVLFPNTIKIGDPGPNGQFAPIVEDVLAGSIFIYDRWGNLMFKSDEIKPVWDGKFNDQECAPGVYTYLYSFVGLDEKAEPKSFQKTGSVLLLK